MLRRSKCLRWAIKWTQIDWLTGTHDPSVVVRPCLSALYTADKRKVEGVRGWRRWRAPSLKLAKSWTAALCVQNVTKSLLTRTQCVERNPKAEYDRKCVMGVLSAAHSSTYGIRCLPSANWRQTRLLTDTFLAIDWIMNPHTTPNRYGIRWLPQSQLGDMDLAEDLVLLSHIQQQMQQSMLWQTSQFV